MKVTVCFDAVKVIVPCGSGELSVGDLIERAVSRYKKATNKDPDDFVQVQVLETSEDQGILDPDDMVCDVLDDKDKLMAVYEESLVNRPSHNGGDIDGMSLSSAGTTSPDVFHGETTSLNEETSIRMSSSMKDENDNTNTTELLTVNAPIKTKLSPPPVAPKPVGYRKPEPSVSAVESVPSEDSGICIDARARIESDSLNSEYSESISTPRVVRTAETAFVAIGTPVLIDRHFEFNGDRSPTKETSSDFEHVDDDPDQNKFILGRNMTRQSMFLDNPVLDRWAELQDEKRRDSVSASNTREEPSGASTSPTEERAFNYQTFIQHDKYERDGISQDSISSCDSDYLLAIELRPTDEDNLGFTIQGYKTADGRELGLIVREISPSGCAARDNRLQVADRIVEVNDQYLMDLPNERAEQVFHAAVKSSVVRLVVSGSQSFVHVPGRPSVPEPVAIQAVFQESIQAEVPEVEEPHNVHVVGGIEPPPGFRDNSKSPVDTPQLSTNIQKFNTRILLELNKGADGLGFSITTRDNPAGGHTPIFVKSILAKGAAIHDGRLKSGDQILEVNDVKMTGKNQGEAVNILRSTQGLVKLLIQREETIQSSHKPAVELNEESTRHLREQGKQVLTFKIPLNMSGAAGLGVSVKGKMTGVENGRNSPRDKGIFVKSVIAGGAASKDGRLKPDDQLLSVNNISFMGLDNKEAIDSLRQAMQSTRLGQAFIEVTIAREREPVYAPGALYASSSLEALNAPEQERPIEASLLLIVNGPEIHVNGPAIVMPQVNNLGEEEDNFDEGHVLLNLTPIKPRNAVQRNESYCFAVNKSSPGYYSPFQNNRARSSPLAPREQPSMASTPTSVYQAYGNMAPDFSVRPTSTVAVPTPPLESTDGGPGRIPTPVPPPRSDSVNYTATANYRIYQHFATAVDTKPSLIYAKVQSNGPPHGSQNPHVRQLGNSPTHPPPHPPPPPPLPSLQVSAQEPISPSGLPSYDQALERLRFSPAVNEQAKRFSWPGSEDSKDVVFAVPDLPEDNPFDREGFGRQSMSEKRGRGVLDAKKTEIYQRRDKPIQKQSRATGDEGSDNDVSPLRKAKSEGQMRPTAIDAFVAHQAPPARPMWKANSEGALRDDEHGDIHFSLRRKNITSNQSFRSAIESNSALKDQVRDVPNGNVLRHSQSEDTQDEIPITMTSKADFNAVQQKLASKKPFYRKFKIGKGRRGDYSLSDNEGSPKHSTYGQEALIDFPAEQRYRQLVSHYGQEDRVETQGRDQSGESNRQSNSSSNMKIGRVIVSEPTRV